MGKGFLIDTNIVIYSLENKIPTNGKAFLATLPPVISDVTRIELLGWYNASGDQLKPVKMFISKATYLIISEAIVLKTITIRQTQKIKLGDAIIAATALVHNYVLVTRNIGDFSSVPGIELINPFEL